MTDEEFAELLAFVNEAAGRQHSQDGDVAKTLRTVLARHALLLAPDPPCRTCQEYDYLFQMQSLRMHQATELWRAEKPEERALIMPDLGRLLEWLLRRKVEKTDVEPMASARALLGREVVVTLSREPEVLSRGRLVSVDEGGEVCIVGEDGFARWGWPLLDIREAT